ncbi:transposase [Magnetococcus sp. PR-3]|uniref:transposase n=1 Tax=Magnetococcus sp. PR-3 TaxID=3120355 RepID=UPI002FCE017A
MVFFDECGFEEEVDLLSRVGTKGEKVYGNFAGSKRKRTNLIMAQRGKEWLTPMIFEGSCHATLVEAWIEKMLLPQLKEPSVIVMDNASFHTKRNIAEILARDGHIRLPLPHIAQISTLLSNPSQP